MSSRKWWDDFDTGSDSDVLSTAEDCSERYEGRLPSSVVKRDITDTGVEEFLAAFKSMAPLLYAILKRDGDVSSELPSVYAEFSSSYSEAAAYLHSQFGNIPDGTLSMLEQQVAETFGVIEGRTRVQAKEHLQSVIRFLVESGHLGNVKDRSILDEDESITKLSVKLKLLPILAELGCWVEQKQLCWFGVHLKEVQSNNIELSVAMAKDLAFHWAKNADVAAREQVFATLIPFCGNALVDTYSCWLLEQLPPLSSKSLSSPMDVYNHYPELCDVLKQHSMGHESPHKQEQLKIEVADLIWSLLPARLQVTDEITQRLRQFSLQVVVSRFTDAWIGASEKMIANLSKLSDEEFMEWRKSEEARSLFHPSSLESEIKNNLFGKTLKIDRSFLSNEAKKRLTIYWAATDAVFTITNELLRDEE